MAEGPRTSLVPGTKPVPMKLFATCEVDRTPPDCVPRLCSLTLTRLMILKPLGPDVSSVSIAIKIQGSKRILRSNEIYLHSNGHFETELQLHFSLQYPHLLKHKSNKLHIMLQRRKKYKHRTFLGYKILADGIIHMSSILQKQLNLYDLDLLNEIKHSRDYNTIIARITINSLSSQPIDFDVSNKGDGQAAEFSDEDDIDLSSNEDVSDSDPSLLIVNRVTPTVSRGPRHSVQQRNLKQKFISLLKKFRTNEDFHNFGCEREIINQKLKRAKMNSVDIEDLFKELELSDSAQDIDTMSSVSSAPKPSLRPFFSSNLSLSQDGLTDPGNTLNLLEAEGQGDSPDNPF